MRPNAATCHRLIDVNAICHLAGILIVRISKPRIVLAAAIATIAVADPPSLQAQQRRAPPPSFDRPLPGDVFFESLEKALGGPRPTLQSLRQSARKSASSSGDDPAATSGDSMAKDAMSGLVSATTLESEFKRVKLRFDDHAASPGAFKSGGFQDASVDLTILATLLAVISQYDGDVRWKKDAAAARDLLAKSATNVRTGTTTAFREAERRRGDLQSLLSGTGVDSVGQPGENDWSEIADRTTLMTYLDEVIDRLEGESYDAESIQENQAGTLRDAEILALIGSVISQPGMESADDEDYVRFASEMTKRASQIRRTTESQNYADAEDAVSTMRESCDRCHQDYR